MRGPSGGEADTPDVQVFIQTAERFEIACLIYGSLQEVIDSFVEKTEREGDPTYYKEFHELADPIYEKFSLDDRESEFKKLYQYLFGIWGFSDIIRNAFDEFPSLKEKIGIVLIRGVLKEDQESVDILRKWGTVEEDLAKQFEAKGLKGVGIKLLPRRFYDPALPRFCRHELLHIKDMLDPAFLYDPDIKVGNTPGEESLILARYRVLWCLSIDSRLTRMEKEPGGRTSGSSSVLRESL